MKIEDFFLDKKQTYIVAEVAQNHDGSLGQAHAFIDAIAKTGADAIKFQTHIAEEESTIDEPFRVQFSYCDKTRYDYWKRMEFTKEQWKGLYQHAKEVGLDFLSSPFSIAALEMLDEIGVPAWKFGSGEVFNDVLLQRAIATGKPIILSTGLSIVAEIDKQVEMVQKAGNPLALMECTTAYPSKAEDIPINMVRVFQERYRCPVGISDHSATIYPSLAAVTLGARMVEVHVTMSRDMFGPDIKASVTMNELSEIVRGVEYISKMMAVQENKECLTEEKQTLKNMFSKSIYAKKDLKTGEILDESTMAIKKPFSKKGIPLKYYDVIYGKRLLRDVAKDEVIVCEVVEK